MTETISTETIGPEAFVRNAQEVQGCISIASNTRNDLYIFHKKFPPNGGHPVTLLPEFAKLQEIAYVMQDHIEFCQHIDFNGEKAKGLRDATQRLIEKCHREAPRLSQEHFERGQQKTNALLDSLGVVS